MKNKGSIKHEQLIFMQNFVGNLSSSARTWVLFASSLNISILILFILFFPKSLSYDISVNFQILLVLYPLIFLWSYFYIFIRSVDKFNLIILGNLLNINRINNLNNEDKLIDLIAKIQNLYSRLQFVVLADIIVVILWFVIINIFIR